MNPLKIKVYNLLKEIGLKDLGDKVNELVRNRNNDIIKKDTQNTWLEIQDGLEHGFNKNLRRKSYQHKAEQFVKEIMIEQGKNFINYSAKSWVKEFANWLSEQK